MFRSFAVERSRCENDACRVNPCAHLSSVDVSLRVHRFAQWMHFNDRSQLRRSPAPWSIHYDELLCTRCHWETLMSCRVASESTRRKRWLRRNREKAFESTIYRFSSLSRGDYRTTDIYGVITAFRCFVTSAQTAVVAGLSRGDCNATSTLDLSISI